MFGSKGGSSGGKPKLTPGGSSRGSKGGMAGPSRNAGTRKGSEGRSSRSMIPQNYLNPKDSYKGMMSKPNNDGNLWTYRKSWKKPGFHNFCFITTAVTRAAGLDDDCYELAVLRMFREQYVANLSDGEKVLADYREKAPKVIQAIEELSGEDSQKVWECLYVAGIVPSVLLITSGKWDEAYDLYRQMCEEIEALFLEGWMDGYDPEHWLDAWIEAKLADALVEALDMAAASGVLPVETIRVRPQGGQASAALSDFRKTGFRSEASHA